MHALNSTLLQPYFLRRAPSPTNSTLPQKSKKSAKTKDQRTKVVHPATNKRAHTCAPSASSLASHVSARGYFLRTALLESREVATTPFLEKGETVADDRSHGVQTVTLPGARNGTWRLQKAASRSAEVDDTARTNAHQPPALLSNTKNTKRAYLHTYAYPRPRPRAKSHSLCYQQPTGSLVYAHPVSRWRITPLVKEKSPSPQMSTECSLA